MIRKQQACAAICERGHYGTVPNELWSRKDLSRDAKTIWAYLVCEDPNWASSRNNIARNLDLGPNRVTKCIQELESLNMVKVVRRRNAAWDFDLIQPSNWIHPALYSEKKSAPGIQLDAKVDPVGSTTGSPGIHIQESISKTRMGSSPTHVAACVPPFEGGDDAPQVKSQEEVLRMTVERIEREAGGVGIPMGEIDELRGREPSCEGSAGADRKPETGSYGFSASLRIGSAAGYWRRSPLTSAFHS